MQGIYGPVTSLTQITSLDNFRGQVSGLLLKCISVLHHAFLESSLWKVEY